MARYFIEEKLNYFDNWAQIDFEHLPDEEFRRPNLFDSVDEARNFIIGTLDMGEFARVSTGGRVIEIDGELFRIKRATP